MPQDQHMQNENDEFVCFGMPRTLAEAVLTDRHNWAPMSSTLRCGESGRVDDTGIDYDGLSIALPVCHETIMMWPTGNPSDLIADAASLYGPSFVLYSANLTYHLHSREVYQENGSSPVLQSAGLQAKRLA
jgi:hypothetical protein